MHLIRYQKHGQTSYGYLEGEAVGGLSGDIFGEFTRGERVAALPDVILLPPCQPSKIIAVADNFADRLREAGQPAPELPPVYFKAPSALVGPGEPIRLPPHARHVEFGAELAVVIGRRARWVSPEEARRYILGYTCANNVVAVDVAEVDQAWTRAASFDTFCPLGPGVVTHLDPAEWMITGTVNGVTRQMASTRDMLFSVPQVVAFLTAAMTLLPGDVILMGSPAGAGPLEAGDVVEVSIEHVGSLRNPVIREG
jgi:2-keto-4-pentenoate hydratase/2-oxohepta-3-ene-1,7-dioic acid hydratase in catechol pathway